MAINIAINKICPCTMFQDGDGSVILPAQTVVHLAANDSGVAFLPAVAGKVTRVLGLSLFADTTATSVKLLAGSAGLWLVVPTTNSATIAAANVMLPPNDIGYLDSAIGGAITATCGSGGAAEVSVRYITFTPAT